LIRLFLGIVVCFLAVILIVPLSSAQEIEAVVTGKMVKIRRHASVNSMSLEAVPLGDKVLVVGENGTASKTGNWINVRYGKYTGYMAKKYLEFKGHSPGESKQEIVTGTRDLGPTNKKILSLKTPAPSSQVDTGKYKPSPGVSAPTTFKILEVADKFDSNAKIKSDIDKLVETLAKEGKEPEIRSVILLYSPKVIDGSINSLRDEVKQLKAVVNERENEVGRLSQENSTLKAQVLVKGKAGVQDKLDAELAAIRERGKEMGLLRTMIASIQKDIADLKPLFAEDAIARKQQVSEEVINLRKVVMALTKSPDFKLISRVESEGQEAFLKGVGNVRMIVDGDLSIFRVPKAASKNGEKTFAHLLKRIITGEEAVYFICSKSMVTEG